MPPKRKAAPKKKKEESPPPSESEPESEPEYSSEEEPESPPKPKKSKPSPKPKTAASKAKVAPTPSPKKAKVVPQKKQLRRGVKAQEVVAEKPSPSPSPQKTVTKSVPKQVVIEHCKQCQSFKRTATKLEQLLKKSIPDLEVTMNPEKPRKGIFEARDGDGNVLVSLQGLVRPFKKMKDLDLEKTADDMVAKLT